MRIQFKRRGLTAEMVEKLASDYLILAGLLTHITQQTPGFGTWIFANYGHISFSCSKYQTSSSSLVYFILPAKPDSAGSRFESLNGLCKASCRLVRVTRQYLWV